MPLAIFVGYLKVPPTSAGHHCKPGSQNYAILRAQAIRWVDDSFPGWIEVRVIDAAGRDHRIVDKVPVLTTLDMRSDTSFPTELWIGADTTDIEGDHVTVRLKWVETQEGLNELVIVTTDVRWL